MRSRGACCCLCGRRQKGEGGAGRGAGGRGKGVRLQVLARGDVGEAVLQAVHKQGAGGQARVGGMPVF